MTKLYETINGRRKSLSMHKINHANIKEWAANYDGELFDGILCDPPYELGFMGKSWDSSGIAFDQEMWADILKLLKPGGHLLAFSGSRTYHRMAVAIEDAGFEIRDMIEWVYGSGFPKSLNIGKVTDKYLKTGNASWNGTGDSSNGALGYSKLQHKQGYRPNDYSNKHQAKEDITEEQAKLWQGYGTALKPAHEPCVLARKPIEGTVANNVLKHGTGGLNIDGTRVGLNGEKQPTGSGDRTSWREKEDRTDRQEWYASKTSPQGRFPANLIHDGSDEVEAVFPNDNQRFFYCSKASKSERNAGLEGFEERLGGAMSGKEYRDDRPPNHTMRANHHPTVKPLSLTKYLATLIKPPTGGRLLVPFSGSGSEMIGALQAGWEFVEGVELTEEYIPIAEARIKYWTNISRTSSKTKLCKICRELACKGCK